MPASFHHHPTPMAKVSPPSPPVTRNRASWLILLCFGAVPALVAGLVTYGTAPPPAPPIFRAEATLMVNRFSPGVFLPGPQKEGQLIEEQFLPHPQALSRLLTTPDVAEAARVIYQSTTGQVAPPLPEILGGLASSNEVLADTAVRRDVSPLIQVTFQHRDATFALGFLQAWTQASVQKVGSLFLSEIKRRLQNLDQTQTSLLQLYTHRSQVLARSQNQLQVLRSEWEALHGSPAPAQDSTLSPQEGQSDFEGPTSAPVANPIRNTGGILTQININRLQQSWNQAVQNGREAGFEQELRTTRTQLLERLSQSEAEVQSLQQEIQILETQVRGLAEAKARLQVHIGAAERIPSSLGAYPAGPELRVVAAPIVALPRQTSRPPTFWALLAAAAAGAVGLLLGLGIRRDGQESA